MSDDETVCPLCQTPRVPGAMRCRCNYTFEYGPPERLRSSQPKKPNHLAGIVLVCALGAAAFAGFFASGIEPRHAPSLGIAWFITGCGVFAVAGGMFGWRWFLASSRAFWPRVLLGTDGARVFYGILGGLLAGAGVALVLR